MNNNKHILCVGEVLWDSLPTGLFLGGAPLNVTFHLHQLGEKAKMISRVGSDRLGEEAIRRIENKGIPGELIQKDPSLETGIVEVQLDETGDPEYTIIHPVAWDNIELTDKMRTEARQSRAIVFGSLALRDQTSRVTIFSLLESSGALKIFDINLRAPFYNKERIQQSSHLADVLKMNKDELTQMREWFSFSSDDKAAIEEMADRFSCQTIVVTRGGEGAVLYHSDRWVEHKVFDVDVKDAVGAGDAFLAALIRGLGMGKESEEALTFANATGAYVASHSGATPEYTYSTIEEFITQFDSVDNVDH